MNTFSNSAQFCAFSSVKGANVRAQWFEQFIITNG
jgi:hypothetical protein